MKGTERYIALLTERAEADATDYDRFYHFLDSDLAALEQRVYETDEADDWQELADALVTLYRRWRDEMGPGRWAAVLAHNDSLSDANRNWLLGELGY